MCFKLVIYESARTCSPCSTYVIRINFVKSVEDGVADVGKPPQKSLLCGNQAAFRSLVMQHPDTNTDCVLLRLRKAEGDLASKHVRCVSGTIYIPLKLPPFTRTGKVIGETLIILLQSVKIPPPSFQSFALSVYIFNIETCKENHNALREGNIDRHYIPLTSLKHFNLACVV